MHRYPVIVVALLLVSSCAGGSGDTVVDGFPDAAVADSVDNDLVPDLAVDPDGGEGPDEWELDYIFDATDITGETDGGNIEPGAPGYPCGSGEECDSGFCIQASDGKVCTITCTEECPFDWSCVQYTPSLPDQVYLCIDEHIELCRPCLTNVDCQAYGADLGQACVSYGEEGYFCGIACGDEGECPSGYTCASLADVSGAMVDQCVLKVGICDCDSRFIDAGASTVCFAENELGLCEGERMCMADGLTDCDAPVPMAESCNGEDDNCDGTIDEETGGTDCALVNDHGECIGTEVCVGGDLTCQGEMPAPETCDGLDNNCNGQVDEGFPDTNSDGIKDCLVADIDGDGVLDVDDNCPTIANADQQDFDLDGKGDVCDLDDDNDMVGDLDDCKPLDPKIHPNADEDCNGIDDDCDYLVDEGFVDTDGDLLKNCIDDDDDNDGLADSDDCYPLDPTLPAEEVCNGIDDDCNGETDEGFADVDNDGVADCVDGDSDGDGLDDIEDNCPAVPNEEQKDQDGDDIGDACDKDLDGDAIPNAVDNCPDVKNTAQGDLDNDGLGDACDDDPDGDDVPVDDNCPLVFNPLQEDGDNDGIGDACEDDKDGDGVVDGEDCKPLDPQVFPGAQEVCDGLDNNCNLLIDEGYLDGDGDLLKDCVDNDDDNDGDPDETDCASLNPAIHQAATEICDGLDNDCDGKDDEDLGELTCGKGQCAHTISLCAGGKTQFCDPYDSASPEVCDGADNDCDGILDEDQGSTTCGLGVCFHTVNNCASGEPQQCDPLAGAGEELCDGLDNDCDGKTDEDQQVLACGKGQCFHTVLSCMGGVEFECNPFEGATMEVCDGQDNDCDGESDEELGTTTCGMGECEHTAENCLNGVPQLCNPLQGASLEICDEVDNDCDGIIDEELGSTTCGEGLCEHTVPNCVAGAPNECIPLEGAVPEECDGQDNNCNGLIDEDFADTDDDGTADCLDTDDDADGVLDDFDNCQQVVNPLQEDQDADEIGDVCDDDLDGDEFGNDVDNCPEIANNDQADLDNDDFGDVCDDDIDGDNDPNDMDCEPDNSDVAHGLDDVCFNDVDDNCSGVADDDPACIKTTCKVLHEEWPLLETGIYSIDPDGEGGLEAFDAYCDMDSNDGGWTIVYSASGADGEQPLVSNTEASGDPLEFMNFNLNHAQKMVLSSLSTESLFKRNTGPWIKTNHALFDQSLSSNTHQHYSVTVESSDGQSVSGWMGYSTINIAHGGDFNVTTTDGKACSYNTNQGVDHHSSSYYHLNCGCQRHYLYSFSSPQGDGDAGYDVHTGLGAWTATQSCDGEEGGTLKFYAAMR